MSQIYLTSHVRLDKNIIFELIFKTQSIYIFTFT